MVLGEGTVHVSLALAHPGALFDADEKRIVNRCVRPLLRALNRTMGAGSPAHFFGRDWVSVARRPAAWVGFAHDATTRRTAFEAFVAVRAPFAEDARPSFRGHAAASLEAIAERTLDPSLLVGAVIEAYGTGGEVLAIDPLTTEERGDDQAMNEETPTEISWAATREEAIGELGAGPDAKGVFRIGGDLLVSRDALSRLEAAAPSAKVADIGALVDDTLARPGVALDGVKSLGSVRDVIVAALHG